MTDAVNSISGDNAKPKTCKSCGETKNVTDFYGYNKKCKICFSRDCQIRKAVRLSDPAARAARNAKERESRARRIAANPEYHRQREAENTAKWRQRNAIANPKSLTPRQIAIRNGQDRYITNKPCPNGHIDFRSTKYATCMACSRDAALTYRANNLELCRQRERDAYAENSETIRARKKVANDLNRDKINEKARARPREKSREACREYYAKNKDNRAEYRRANRARYTMHANNRRANLLQATPAWADMEAIAAIYEEAARLTEETGMQHDVDHYYPLQGRTCRGLHVANNLRIIPHTLNLSKGNKMPTPDDIY